MARTTFIYALCEPGTRIVRYVGMTKNMPKRLQSHVSGSSKHSSLLGEWIRGLLSTGLRPEIRLLKESSLERWREDEARFIRTARDLGYELVNGNGGGGGRPFLSPLDKEKISATLKGRAPSKQCISAARATNTGAKRSAASRARMRLAHTGVPLSEGHRRAKSLAQRGEKNFMFGKKIPADVLLKRTASRARLKALREANVLP